MENQDQNIEEEKQKAPGFWDIENVASSTDRSGLVFEFVSRELSALGIHLDTLTAAAQENSKTLSKVQKIAVQASGVLFVDDGLEGDQAADIEICARINRLIDDPKNPYRVIVIIGEDRGYIDTLKKCKRKHISTVVIHKAIRTSLVRHATIGIHWETVMQAIDQRLLAENMLAGGGYYGGRYHGRYHRGYGGGRYQRGYRSGRYYRGRYQRGYRGRR